MIYTTLPISGKPLDTVSYDIIHHEKQRSSPQHQNRSPEGYHETTIQFDQDKLYPLNHHHHEKPPFSRC